MTKDPKVNDSGCAPESRRNLWLAVDVDGVLADHVAHILPLLKRDYHFNATVDEITAWDFPVSDTTFGAIIRNKQCDAGFTLSIPVIADARASLKQLIASYNVAIVTARPPEADRWTLEWLRKKGIEFDFYANLRVGAKHETSFPCDVLIDDYTANILAFLQHTEGCAILFSQPWNQERTEFKPYLESGRLRIAHNWPEIVSMIPAMFQGGGLTIR